MRNAITETALIIPALAVLTQQEDVISTRQLKNGILKLIKAKKADRAFVTDRNQTIIDSRIDNLISHRTLAPFVTYNKIGGKVYIRINGKGKTLISEKLLKLSELV